MRAVPLLACLLAASALLAGCADGGRPSPAPAASSALAAAAEPDEEDLEAVLDEEFLIDSAAGSGTLAFEWPRAGRAYMALAYADGAFMDAAFTLGACEQATPIEGAGVLVAGQGAVLMGSMSTGVLYECGWLAAGDQQVAWSIGAGVLRGRVQVYAEA